MKATKRIYLYQLKYQYIRYIRPERFDFHHTCLKKMNFNANCEIFKIYSAIEISLGT